MSASSGSRTALVLAVLMLAAQVQAAPPRREQQAREREARAQFAVGNYQKAVDLYGQLFADTLHPTYLRNIGRCQQLMGEPDKAINSFREYLRKAPKLSAAEKTEVEGFIAEMTALKAKKEARPTVGPVPDRPHAKLGNEHYQKRQFAEALREFQTDHAASADPFDLYNMGLCQAALKQPEEAVRSFKRFLAERPNEPRRASIEARIKQLEETVPPKTP